MSNSSDSAVTEIDPRFLHGFPSLAAELFPDDPQLARLQGQLVGSYADFQDIQKRTDETMTQWDAVDAEVRATRDEAARLELSHERVALAGLLVHAPNDVASAAANWAHTLIAWSEYVRPRARNLAEQAAQVARPIEAAQHRALHNLEPGLPMSAAVDPEQKRSYREKATRLADEARPHAAMRESALALWRGAQNELVGRFGDLDARGSEPGGGGAVLPQGQVREWIDSIRQQWAERTQRANPLVSDALRPKGALV